MRQLVQIVDAEYPASRRQQPATDSGKVGLDVRSGPLEHIGGSDPGRRAGRTIALHGREKFGEDRAKITVRKRREIFLIHPWRTCVIDLTESDVPSSVIQCSSQVQSNMLRIGMECDPGLMA